MKFPRILFTSLLAPAILSASVAWGGARIPERSGVVPPSVNGPASLDLSGCDLGEREAALLLRLAEDPGQRRHAIRCDGALSRFARARAEDMATRGYFGHVTPERAGPNGLLRDAGYPLPSLYGGHMANSVEAIVAGFEQVERVWRELLDSPRHRRHVLGEVDFFREQDEIGIAHVQNADSEYGDYWVIIMARRERPDEPRYLCSPEPAVCFELRGRAQR